MLQVIVIDLSGDGQLTFPRVVAAEDKYAEVNMELMDIDSEHLGIPDNDYDAVVKMSSSQFAQIVKDLGSIGDTGEVSQMCIDPSTASGWAWCLWMVRSIFWSQLTEQLAVCMVRHTSAASWSEYETWVRRCLHLPL